MFRFQIAVCGEMVDAVDVWTDIGESLEGDVTSSGVLGGGDRGISVSTPSPTP
jgi:hypothetical protein